MRHYRWFVIGLAFIAIIITYLDRAALSYAISPLEKTFGLTNADFGIIAAGFGIGYLVMTVGGGILVDRYGSRRIWAISAVIWSLACMMLGFANGFLWLFIFRVLLGAAEGPGFPALSRVTANWLLPREAARAFAFALVAVPLSSVIGAPVISWLITWFGWRVMFISLGSLGIIWALVWMLLFRDYPHESKHISKAELQCLKDAGVTWEKSKTKGNVHTSWRFMLLSPSLISNNFAFFTFGYLLFFSIIWLPGYFEQTHHIQLKTIGIFLMIPWLVASAMLLLGGFLSDRLWMRFHSLRIARSHMIWICQIVSAICLIWVVLSPSVVTAIIGISLGLGFGMMPNAVFYSLNTDLAKDRAGTSLGIMDSALALAGILAPYLTGLFSDLTGNFNVAIYLMAGLSLLSALSIIIFQHPDKELREKFSKLS
ncbi:MAG TPA: MFS transporter [Gammaproteobacteria bacterium]|nr:MFS transporter [Gammaproteobacteria bacterium]